MLPLLVRIWKCLVTLYVTVSTINTFIHFLYKLFFSAVVQDYLAHIIDTSRLPIGPEQVCALFGNIEDIYEFNR